MSAPRTVPRVGMVTISDRASRGEYEDRSGPAIRAYLDEILRGPWHAHPRIVADDQPALEALLRDLVDEIGCDLVLTSGGTGPAPRDVTPEALTTVCERILPGFGEAMRLASLREVPTAILSRQLAGTRGRCLLIALPGSPRAIRTCLDAVFAAVPDCVDQLGGARFETDPGRLAAYRPH